MIIYDTNFECPIVHDVHLLICLMNDGSYKNVHTSVFLQIQTQLIFGSDVSSSIGIRHFQFIISNEVAR